MNGNKQNLYFFRSKENGEFDRDSSSVIKLTNGTVMYLREVTKYLALVCILREESFEKQGECIFIIISSPY